MWMCTEGSESAGEEEKESGAEAAGNPTKDAGSCPAGHVQQERICGQGTAESDLTIVEQGDRGAEAEAGGNTVGWFSGEAEDQPAEQTSAGGTRQHGQAGPPPRLPASAQSGGWCPAPANLYCQPGDPADNRAHQAEHEPEL